jgi:AraC family transcriptional regulator, regulatory protein of adaptative response / DNA-3-methyladenine glycosylase II
MISKENLEIYYRAMVSRDPRFDGLFFVGVTTTGIYCRPICPAPKPKQANVVFYSSSAGAEHAGFRPCKRCRPEASPGTPAWSGTSATVSRALQLINHGYLDGHPVEQLGARLGIGGRQLRRLFQSHLGASPHAVALTRRLDFARQLLDETSLSMTDIAFASGFESIRRFNDAVKKRFGRSPSILREAGRKISSARSNRNRMVLQLPFRPPLDWPALLSYLHARQIPGVEIIANNTYNRSIHIPSAALKNNKTGEHYGFLQVKRPGNAPGLELTLQMNSTANLMNAVQRVRRIFDLEADPMFITAHLAGDPALSSIVSAFPGLRVPGGWDNFEIAIRAIVGQQVSIQAANTIIGRMVRQYGTPLNYSILPGITHGFPRPGTLASADLTGIGLPTKRAATIRSLSSRVASGDIQLEGAGHPEPLKRALLEIPGIGQWTVEYIAMRALREPDAFPATDLVLKRSLAEMFQQEKNPHLEMKRPEAWRPWRAYAAMYLWRKWLLQPHKTADKEN